MRQLLHRRWIQSTPIGFRSNVTAEHRNTLYAAHDVEVLSRHYPGVTPENAEARDACEAALQVESFRKGLGDQPLRDLIRVALAECRTLTPTQDQRPKVDAAESYWTGVARKRQGSDAGSPDAALAQNDTKQATPEMMPPAAPSLAVLIGCAGGSGARPLAKPVLKDNLEPSCLCRVSGQNAGSSLGQKTGIALMICSGASNPT